jgi:hypothetical protein
MSNNETRPTEGSIINWVDTEGNQSKMKVSGIGTPIGAWAIIKWYDSGMEDEVYISFGTWNENEWGGEFDSLGNCDDEVFFYCEGGEEELKSLVGTSNEDFVVLSYDIDYSIPLVLADMDEPVFAEDGE